MKTFIVTSKDQYTQAVKLKAGTYTFHAIVKGEIFSIGFKDIDNVWLDFDLSWQVTSDAFQEVKHTFQLEKPATMFSLMSSAPVGYLEIIQPMLEEGTNASTKKANELDDNELLGNVIEEAVNNLEMEGKSYIRNGNFLAGTNEWGLNAPVPATPPIITALSGGVHVPDGAMGCLKVVTAQAGAGVWQDFTTEYNRLELNIPYTLSFALKKDMAGTLDILFGSETQSTSTRTITVNNEWQKHELTFTPTTHENVVFYAVNAGTFYITNIALHRGTKRQPFRNGYLDEALQVNGEINGGLTLSSVIAARNADRVVRSYMSGIDSNPTAFAAGVENFGEEENEKRMIELNHDGSGHLAGGSLWWNILGELFLGKEYADKSINISPTAVLPTIAEIQNKENYSLPILNEYITKDFNNPAHQNEVSDLYVNYIQEFEVQNDAIFNAYINATYYYGVNLPLFGVDGTAKLEKHNGSTWDIIEQGAITSETGYHELSLYLTNLNISRGRYRIVVSTTCGETTPNGANAVVNLYKNFEIDYQLKVKRLTIASDGIAFSDSLSDSYFRLSLQDSIPLRYNGAADMPAGLGGGSVEVSSGGTNLWGRAISATRAGSTVTINHGIEDLKYTVQVALNGSSTWYFQDKTANNIKIVCSGAFDFILVRTPY